MSRRKGGNPCCICHLCGKYGAYRPDAVCDACFRFVQEYECGTYEREHRLLVREIHALRQREAKGLPLFVHGRLAVREGD